MHFARDSFEAVKAPAFFSFSRKSRNIEKSHWPEVEGSVYVLGGSRDGEVIPELERFAPPDVAWTALASMGCARADFVAGEARTASCTVAMLSADS